MNILKRTFVVITRQFGKSAILFLIISIFATILLGATSTRYAMIATEGRLLMQIPSVATVVYEIGDISSETPWRQPTREEIEQIGSLPYVRVYDFTLRPFFYSEDLVWAYEDNPGQQMRGRPFEGRGVNHPEIADLETGIVQLIEGRTFTQEEIDTHALVVVIPREIAIVSSLTLGSMIEIENVVYNFFWENEEDQVLAAQTLEVEVIGIVGRDVVDVTGDPDFFYMPFGLAEDMLAFRESALNARAGDLLAMDEDRFMGIAQEIFQDEPLIEALFVLNSPRDLEDLSLAAIELLPENWIMIGIGESRFTPVIASMDAMLQLADSIQWFIAVSVAVVLTLIILLFLRDRRHEIGIYRALGDKKSKIMIQIITEVGIITVVSFIFAAFASSLLSETISANLFEQHLVEQMNDDEIFGGVPGELALHDPGIMSIEDAMGLYDVTLDTRTIIAFASAGLIVVFSSTIIPIWYVLKLEPKELLL